MSASTMEQASVLGGRQLVLLGVIAAHAVVISALMTMRYAVDARKPPPVFLPPTTYEPPPPPPEKPAPAPTPEQPDFTLQVPSLPVPVIRAPEPVLSTRSPAPVRLPLSPGVADAVPTGPVRAVATELSYRATRSPDDYYPSASIALQEQGATILRICVGSGGRLVGRPLVERSSGSTRLDAAAVKWASEALVFTPATRNGAGVSACKGFRVNFTLR